MNNNNLDSNMCIARKIILKPHMWNFFFPSVNEYICSALSFYITKFNDSLVKFIKFPLFVTSSTAMTAYPWQWPVDIEGQWLEGYWPWYSVQIHKITHLTMCPWTNSLKRLLVLTCRQNLQFDQQKWHPLASFGPKP